MSSFLTISSLIISDFTSTFSVFKTFVLMNKGECGGEVRRTLVFDDPVVELLSGGGGFATMIKAKRTLSF